MGRIVLASSNPGKLAEFQSMLADAELTLLAQGTFGIAAAAETGTTFVENALIKARHASHATGLPALADDSGLCVDALGGAPGLYSARYAGRHGDAPANNAKLLRELDGIGADRRGALFICILVLLRDAADPAPLIAEGRWHGRILGAPRGQQGFGYDPLFLPDGQQQSAAELDVALKNRISHRGQALAVLRQQFDWLHASGEVHHSRSRNPSPPQPSP